ncbi:MAG: DUF6781 family protein [Burkholderiales bacterium]
MNETVTQQVQKAIAEGRRVQEAVHDIALKALARHELDFEAMRKVTREAVDAVREAAGHQDIAVKDAAKQAIGGIDHALAHAAEALKLSIQEASSRTEKFSREDLAKARADLAELERMFVETLGEAARAARGTAKATLEDLARHAETSGTAVGRQLRESAALSGQFAEAARKQFESGIKAVAASSALIARAAAGVLAGIADTLESKRKH